MACKIYFKNNIGIKLKELKKNPKILKIELNEQMNLPAATIGLNPLSLQIKTTMNRTGKAIKRSASFGNQGMLKRCNLESCRCCLRIEL